MNRTEIARATGNAVALATVLGGDELQRIAKTSNKSEIDSTLRTYGSHVREFAKYCEGRGWSFVPGNVFARATDKESTTTTVEIVGAPARVDWVLAHLQTLADNGASLATIDGRIRALNRWHVVNGYTDPAEPMLYRPNHDAVTKWYEGCQNTYAELNANGERLQREAPGLLRSDLRAMVRACDTTTLTGLRDRALLLIGWGGAFRRSELVGVTLENITYDNEGRGILVSVYNTKTNKRSATVKQIDSNTNDPELCPLRALNAWLERAGITSGLVFRSVSKSGAIGETLSARMVDKIVREYDNNAGINKGFSAHSLRAGYATQATIDNVPDALIRAQGWADNSTVVFRYQRRAMPFTQRRIGGS
jgi:integrase